MEPLGHPGNMIELHQAGTCRCITGNRQLVSAMSWLALVQYALPDLMTLSAHGGVHRRHNSLTTQTTPGWKV